MTNCPVRSIRPAFDLRRLSQLPHFADFLEPCDVVLFWAEMPSVNAVCIYQKRAGFPEKSCNICHVGLCLDEKWLAHSMPADSSSISDGVRLETVENAVRGKIISIVRISTLRQNFPDAIKTIVDLANDQIGKPYDYRSVATLTLEHLRKLIGLGRGGPEMVALKDGALAGGDGQPGKGSRNEYESFMCSDFVFHLFERALREGNPFADPRFRLSPNALPAQFFLNSRVEDVLIR